MKRRTPTIENAFNRWLWPQVQARVAAGQAQADIAKDIGISPSRLSDWLNGKTLPELRSSFKIARLFGVDTEMVEALIAQVRSGTGLFPTAAELTRLIEAEMERQRVAAAGEARRSTLGQVVDALRKAGFADSQIARTLGSLLEEQQRQKQASEQERVSAC